MRNRTAVLLGAALLLSACVETGPTATSWGGAAYFMHPGGRHTFVSARGGARAAVATYGNVTSVSTSAGSTVGSTMVTDGTSTTMASRSGDAQAALGTSGGATVISTSTGGASASIATYGNISAGSTQAGTATSTW